MIATLALLGTDPTAGSGNWLEDNFLNIALFGLLAIVIIFMFRNSRKRRRDMEELQDKMIPGAEVMTQTGIFGTLISIDDESNQAIIETTPGTKLRVHRQVLSRVVEPELPVIDTTEAEPRGVRLNEDNAISSDPEFGERSEETKPKRAPRKKPTE